MGFFDFIAELFGSTPSRDEQTRPTSPSPAQRPASIPQADTDPLFWGTRTPLSKRIITEQVYDVAEHIFTKGVDFDEQNAHWVVFPEYHLPYAWKGIARTTSLMVVFPTDYPVTPPIGFYMKGDIPVAPGGHFYTEAYHSAAKSPLRQGWKWYCVYVNPGSWRPCSYRKSGDWKRGDNLYTYLTLIKEALSGTSA